MKFSRRIKLYLVGFVLGLIIVFIIFRDRQGIKWLPEERVLLQLDTNALVIPEPGKCFMECNGISEKDVDDLLKNGEVKFSASDTKATPCKKYAVDGTTVAGKKIRILFAACETETRVLRVTDLSKEITCDCK